MNIKAINKGGVVSTALTLPRVDPSAELRPDIKAWLIFERFIEQIIVDHASDKGYIWIIRANKACPCMFVEDYLARVLPLEFIRGQL